VDRLGVVFFALYWILCQNFEGVLGNSKYLGTQKCFGTNFCCENELYWLSDLRIGQFKISILSVSQSGMFRIVLVQSNMFRVVLSILSESQRPIHSRSVIMVKWNNGEVIGERQNDFGTNSLFGNSTVSQIAGPGAASGQIRLARSLFGFSMKNMKWKVMGVTWKYRLERCIRFLSLVTTCRGSIPLWEIEKCNERFSTIAHHLNRLRPGLLQC